MPEIPQILDLNVETYKTAFSNVWSYATRLLAGPMFRHYTDHTIEHSQRVILSASALIDEISSVICSEAFARYELQETNHGG